jgi:hypothetical protein
MMAFMVDEKRKAELLRQLAFYLALRFRSGSVHHPYFPFTVRQPTLRTIVSSITEQTNRACSACVSATPYVEIPFAMSKKNHKFT